MHVGKKMGMPFDNILCGTLSLWPSHGRHARPIENTVVLCVNLRAKKMTFFFSQRCFWKQLIFAVLYPHVKGMFTELFSRCVKEVLGKMALNNM